MASILVKKADRVRHENSPACIAYEYLLGDNDIDVAIIEINGRYPEHGLAANEAVKELCLVVSGAGKIVIEGKETGLGEGDAVIILSKEKYFFDGNLKLAVSCTPPWHPGQYRHYD